MGEASGVEPCTFDLEETAAEEQSVRFLDIKVRGRDCGDKPADWLTKFMGEPLRLFKHDLTDDTRRLARPKYKKLYPVLTDDCVPMFADVTPYLVTSGPSLRDLNSRLDDVAFQMRTFRFEIYNRQH